MIEKAQKLMICNFFLVVLQGSNIGALQTVQLARSNYQFTLQSSELRNLPLQPNFANQQSKIKWRPSRVRNVLHSTADDDSIQQNINEQDDAGAELNFWGRSRKYIFRNKIDDGLTFKQRLAKMGVATVLSYGMVSNVSYAILVALSWYGFSAQV